MKRYFLLGLAIICVVVVGIISYGAYLNKAGENAITEKMSERRIPLQGATVTNRNIKTRVMLDTVNLYSNEMTDTIALIDGRISSINVQKNDFVRSGDVIFDLTNEQYPLKIRQAEIDILKADSDILKADSDIVKAQTYLARAKNDYTRYSRLREHQAISAEKFDEVVAVYKEAQVNLDVANLQKDQALSQRDSLVAQKQQLQLENSHSQVTAPIDGEVLILYKQLGAYVSAGTPLALIGNFRNLYFSMPVDDTLAKRLAAANTVSLNFNSAEITKVYDTEYEAGNAGVAQKFTAQIYDISPAISQPAAIRSIIWQVNNSAGVLEPQTYNKVEISSLSGNSCLTVPLAAMTDPSNTAVFVCNSEGVLERRNITTGVDDGTFIEVLSGLKEGEIVITSGTDGLSEGLKASVTLEEVD